MYFLYEPVFTNRNNNKTVSNIKFTENIDDFTYI